MIALLTLGVALAYTPAGMGVPEVGGGLAGSYEDGALGLHYNPAAAAPEAWEIAVDAAAVWTRLSYELEIAPGRGFDNAGWSFAPHLAAAVPFGDFGVGLAVYAPMARGGKPGAADAPERFHSVSGKFQALEGSLSLAWQPHPNWSFGLSGRLVNLTLASARAMDAGAVMVGIVGDGEGIPIGDPFLEGFQDLHPQSGWGFGGAFGLSYRPASGPRFHASFFTPVTPKVTGWVTVVPSNDLSLVLDAQVTSKVPLPARAYVAFGMPLGPIEVLIEGGWVGWSSMATFESTLSDLAISSVDPVMQAILEQYGVTEGEFLNAVGGARSISNMHDSYNVRIVGVFPVHELVETRASVGYNSSAVPESHVHPGNLDFQTVNVGAVVSARPFPQLQVALSGNYYYNVPRHIEDSKHSLDDQSSSGALLPSGNGVYTLGMVRAGLTLVVRR